MGDIAWRLVDNGYAVVVYDVHPMTRQVSVRRKIKFRHPVNEAEALCFINATFPREELALAAGA